ncbi:DUF732 domain-containing protein [Mycobacteroides abscessus]|uniref:DUF732 domain-containing protein n=2 Tax=Mycobacteroides abscessus TaxID=36809 RepID=UPI0005E20BB7|nr:DUF732 domain-containing protein [Mycobacteroides abscessus]MDO3010075.1 DUF732 domain-containing protein [Mycobacteroides abscessus subsp. abscessus]CPS15924.1 Bacteriophage protein [Mycobacteroides abscessus]CPS51568.1 Bacteriophage protein [Mycobacteroides abscessus]CPS88071.1 Bacteriophage protein [Mycobacteroides abscessus]CPU30264.1 Bacteriophage protein [Mycobacteroides abscessus]
MQHRSSARPTRLLIAAGVGATVAALASPVPAHADPVIDYTGKTAPTVCALLDSTPTFGGIAVVGQLIHNDGLTYEAAGRVIKLSIEAFCPRHVALWNRFVDSANSQTPDHTPAVPAPAPTRVA